MRYRKRRDGDLTTKKVRIIPVEKLKEMEKEWYDKGFKDGYEKGYDDSESEKEDSKEVSFNEWRTCDKCELIRELMDKTDTNHGYWLCTELFMELHDGKDYCTIEGTIEPERFFICNKCGYKVKHKDVKHCAYRLNEEGYLCWNSKCDGIMKEVMNDGKDL